jgi:hypothetical protein
MLDDWEIQQRGDLPDEIWRFLAEERFFGMIIPEAHGGLGFSAAAHSAVVTKLSSRCIAAAVTVMVPNSLGPAELLLHYGTDAQRRHYLPRLARGEEVPCFALTGPEAGSDAAATQSEGIVARGRFEGKDVIHVNFVFTNVARAFVLGLSGGRSERPPVAGAAAPWFGRITRTSAAFALVSDACMATLGGELKRREEITGRLADVLAWLYLACSSARRRSAACSTTCPAAPPRGRCGRWCSRSADACARRTTGSVRPWRARCSTTPRPAMH